MNKRLVCFVKIVRERVFVFCLHGRGASPHTLFCDKSKMFWLWLLIYKGLDQTQKQGPSFHLLWFSRQSVKVSKCPWDDREPSIGCALLPTPTSQNKTSGPSFHLLWNSSVLNTLDCFNQVYIHTDYDIVLEVTLEIILELITVS